ncbi:MAG: succinate--CoA ligase, partial [Sulfurovum sp.]
MSKMIQLAHSPDADDIFMYYAIKFAWVDTKGYEFSNIGLDIETLNVEALKGTYDVSAISFGMYPLIKDEYALLRTAVSFGEGYGPKLIRRKEQKLKRNFKVALSGKYTTNAMLFRLYYPDARVVYMDFLEIENAVVSGKVDAGVLIHESILDFDENLEVEKELWDIWMELAGEGLPLPLGGMAIRRSIPLNRAIEIENILIDGVKVANEKKAELCAKLEADNLVRISDKMLTKYLDM